ncbi:formyltransferase family protein [Rhodospirillales bacterium]|nr:formyltransferase family protein [Rhodospirillales bacterium]
MKLDGVILVAAYTARSRAYAQAIKHAGLTIEHVVLLGDPTIDTRTETFSSNDKVKDLFLPQLDTPLRETCDAAGWPITKIACSSINDSIVEETLRALTPTTIIYSGFSGQLVGSNMLSMGMNILHIHAGRLPDYRGSTTIYYSWLIENQCGVSAILLDQGIDTGPVIARRQYPPPPHGMNVDHLYDSALRADLLVDVLTRYSENNELPKIETEPDGQTYFVIHPVLKHIALLQKQNDDQD